MTIKADLLEEDLKMLEPANSISPENNLSINSPVPPLELSPRQNMLYQALFEKNSSLANIYAGAIRVALDTGNPDRQAMASHNLRELLERLPRYIGVDIKQRQVRLGDKVRALRKPWDNACNNSGCHRSAIWEGVIDAPLLKMLKETENFFRWYDENFQNRKLVISHTLKKLDPAPVTIPKPIEDLHIQEWDHYHNFFVAIAHHGKNVPEEEYSEWLHSLERFLLDRLRPRTFEEISEIDEIIRQAEENG